MNGHHTNKQTMKKYEVIYTIRIEVNAEDSEEAHERADAELHELVASTLDDTLYLNCELYKYPRTINEITIPETTIHQVIQ